MDGYQSLHNLPSLAGISGLEEAMRSGLSIDQSVTRLKRFHYALKRLHQIFVARITAEPIYELKMGFSLHSYLCAEYVSAFSGRVAEMREPPLGLEIVPNAALEIFFDEIIAAPTTEMLLAGVYAKALPALKSALEQYLAATNLLADAPTVRICRLALFELADVLTFGNQCLASLVTTEHQADMTPWLAELDHWLAAGGGLDGTSEDSVPSGSIARRYSAQPYHYEGHPRRDERFADPYNMGVNAEVFLYDARYPASAKTLMMFYKRLREIDVPEMMASIITETPDKPWNYYRDMTRQLWDEARHAMMGEVGFARLGVDWRKVMVNFTWSLGLNTQLTPLERHGVLYFIEQGLMPRTGKRFEWEVAVASQNPLSAVFQDYDWADEVLHAQIGRAWYVSAFKSAHEALRFGDEAWSSVLIDWGLWRDQGLTQHRNWWSDVYRAACARWGVDPDPEVLSFATTYEGARADLKEIKEHPASG